MFTVSVGNLPPGASVLIKITYVAELLVEGENIVFSLPGSVAPWKKDAALDTTTQVCVCVCVCCVMLCVYMRMCACICLCHCVHLCVHVGVCVWVYVYVCVCVY